jgi:hypothetical protein
MEQKLDKLQKQTAANTAAAATANAKADAKVNVTNANAAYPVKGPIAPSDAVVTMPNNRPTVAKLCKAGHLAISRRYHVCQHRILETCDVRIHVWVKGDRPMLDATLAPIHRMVLS